MTAAAFQFQDGETLGAFARRVGWRVESGESYTEFLRRVRRLDSAEPARVASHVERSDSQGDGAEPDALTARAEFLERRINGWRAPRRNASAPAVSSVPPADPSARSSLRALQSATEANARAASEAISNLEEAQQVDPLQELDIARANAQSAFATRVQGSGRTPRRGGR